MSLILNGTDGLSDVDGTAGTPAIRGTDANTGIFFPAADTIAFAEGGSESMRIDSSGNVGIGTATTTNSKFTVVASTGGTGGIRIESQFGAAYFGNYNNYPATMYDGASLKPINVYDTNNNANILYTNNSERMRIDSSGRILLGTTSTSSFDEGFRLNPTGSGNSTQVIISNTGGGLPFLLNRSDDGNIIDFRRAGTNVGAISVTTSSTSYNTSSDYRLKENIAPMTGALAKITQLKPVTYTWKSTGKTSQGFIAHELQAVVPDCVTGEKDGMQTEQYEITPAIPATLDGEGNELTPAVEAVMGERELPAYQGVDTSFLVATLTAAIQELKAELDSIKAELATLKAQP